RDECNPQCDLKRRSADGTILFVFHGSFSSVRSLTKEKNRKRLKKNEKIQGTRLCPPQASGPHSGAPLGLAGRERRHTGSVSDMTAVANGWINCCQRALARRMPPAPM